MTTVISVENLSKAYRLGQVGTGNVDTGHLLYSIIFNRVEQTFMDTV